MSKVERVQIGAAAVLVGLAVLACKGGRTEGAEDAQPTVAPTVADTGPSLTRYDDEQAVDEVVVTLKKPASARFAAEAAAPEVASLKTGDKIVPIVVHGEWALVAVGATASATPQGWVSGDAIIDALKPKPAAAKPKVCKDGYAPQFFEGVTTCIKTCKKDGDCTNPPCANGRCMSDDEEPTLAAAAAAKKAAASASAASRGAPGATVDQITLRTTPQGDPIEKCPAGWVGMPGGACNRPCKSDADCHGKNKCQKLGADRFCDDQKWD